MKIKQYKGFQHFADRDPKRPIDYLVVHSFALSVPKMIEVCNQNGVGPHYIIDMKGNIIQLVSEDKTAWHAGKSFWNGVESLNAASIGIELQNMTLGQTKYPDVQIKAFITLAKDIMKRHKILPQNVVGHSDIAPTRKVDPGIAFPWANVAKFGIGISSDDTSKTISRAKIATLLKRIGYDVTNEKAALLAFMRRFTPEKIASDPDISHLEENLAAHIQRCSYPDKDTLQRLQSVARNYQQHRSLSTQKKNAFRSR